MADTTGEYAVHEAAREHWKQDARLKHHSIRSSTRSGRPSSIHRTTELILLKYESRKKCADFIWFHIPEFDPWQANPLRPFKLLVRASRGERLPIRLRFLLEVPFQGENSK